MLGGTRVSPWAGGSALAHLERGVEAAERVALEEVVDRLVGPALALPRRRRPAAPAAATNGLHAAAHVAGEAPAHDTLDLCWILPSPELNSSGLESSAFANKQIPLYLGLPGGQYM